MKLVSESYSGIVILYDQSETDEEKRVFTFIYEVDSKISTSIEVDIKTYNSFVEGKAAYSIYKESSWILCCVKKDFINAHIIMPSSFEEKELIKMFPVKDKIYLRSTEDALSDSLVDGDVVISTTLA
jgi:hypothetical protein